MADERRRESKRQTHGAGPVEPIPEESVERGHERRDIGSIIMLLFGVGLTASVVFGVVVSLFVFDVFDVERIRRERAAAEGPRPPISEPPPEPRLQVAPGEQLRQLRRQEEALLSHYAWVNREARIVRIPVERAMDLLAERGLPHRDGHDGGGGSEAADAGEVGGFGAPAESDGDE